MLNRLLSRLFNGLLPSSLCAPLPRDALCRRSRLPPTSLLLRRFASQHKLEVDGVAVVPLSAAELHAFE